ncbi:MAG: hypothetical protein M1818_002396 [Claussenomyces sp. TS43310]|nr:MAG: hypothetical protein M1818_002396 [Claussenomyces sp. TS43310]
MSRTSFDSKVQKTEAIVNNHAEKDPSSVAGDSDSAQVPGRVGEGDRVYPEGMKLILILVSLYLCMFLVALDRTILTTAIPRITDEFNSLGDVGWYASSYLITSCSFQLVFGRVYKFFSTKLVLLICIGIFEVGSAVCGAAPSSTAFIVARAISGLGSAGIFSGCIVVIVSIIPLRKRPLYQGLFGAVFGLSSVIGPLMGGAFTSKVSWRWCFYINLPAGAVTVLILILILSLPPIDQSSKTIRQKLWLMDPIGTCILLPACVCLLLALQWGGTTYAWKNARIISLLILGGLFLISFMGVQIWKGDAATTPPRIVRQRSVAAGMLYSICSGSAMIVMIYYMPIWFQAIQGVTAVESGIRMIPLVLSLVLGSILAGFVTFKVGYYKPQMIIASVVMSTGAGLLTLLEPHSGKGKWIGFQIIFGLGLGTGMQQPGMAAQTVLKFSDIPIGTSMMFFMQFFGGAIFASVAQNIFTNRLIALLAADVPGIDARVVVNAGATDLRSVAPPEYLDAILNAYNGAIVDALYVSVAMSCATIVGALMMEMKSVKEGKKAVPASVKGAEAA